MLSHAEVYNALADKKNWQLKDQGLNTVHQCFMTEFGIEKIVFYTTAVCIVYGTVTKGLKMMHYFIFFDNLYVPSPVIRTGDRGPFASGLVLCPNSFCKM
jgi:hypothetical protein